MYSCILEYKPSRDFSTDPYPSHSFKWYNRLSIRYQTDNVMAEVQDINQAFDDIFLCEEHLTQSAYEEGFQKGKQEGNPEGYHLGYHRGAEIGAELGYYLGVIETYLARDNLKEKLRGSLTKIKELIESFPKINEENVDIIGKLDEIRAVYKKTCSLLKIDGKFPEADKMNF
ncbi:uncharacterized protein CBL_12475 [Carabus blaptoides fortunei]